MAAGNRKLVVEFIGDTSNLEKAFNRAGDTTSKRGKQISDASKGIALGIGGIAIAAVKTAADYQTSMNTLQAVSGATGKQMKQLGQLAIKLGADTKLPATSAKDASEAMTEMVKSGVSLKDTMAGVRSTLVLSAAAGVSNARAAEIASNALNTFKLRGKQVAAVADELANTANASSVEINDVADSLQMAGAVFSGFQAPVLGAKGALTELNVAIGLLGNAGIKGSDAGTSLKQTLLQLTGPSNKSKDAMKALYISAKDAGASQKLLADVTREGATIRGKDLKTLIAHNKALGGSADIAYTATGSMRSLKDIIALVAKGTSKMTQEEKNSYLTQIFGADATRSIIALMKAGPGAWDKMTHSVTKQGSAQALANAKMKGLNGAIESLKSTVETLAITFGTVLLPPLTMLIKKLAGLGPFLEKNKTLITIVVGALGALAAATWAVNLAMSANPFVAVVIALAALGFALVKAYHSSETFRSVVQAVFGALQTAAMAVKGAFIDAVHWVSQAVQTVIAEVKQWDTLASVVKRIFGLITGYARLLFDTLKLIFKAELIVLGPIVTAAWTAITEIFKGAWTEIKGVVSGGFTVLRGIVQVIGGLFKGDFHQVWEGVKTIFHGGLTALKGILQGAWAILKAPVDALAAGLHDAFSNTWGRIKGVFSSGVNAVIDFLNVLIKAINFIPGIPDIKTIGHIGSGGGQKGNSAFGGQGAPAKLARGGAFARTGGLVNRPMTLMGEEAPRHPEFVIPTNPAYRGRAVGLLGQAATAIGFAKGGIVGGALSGAKRGARDALLGLVPGLSGATIGSITDLASFKKHLPNTNGLGWMKGLGTYVLGKAVTWAKGAFDKVTGPSGGPSGPVPSGSVRGWLTQALKITGFFSPANLSALYSRTLQESGGNPKAINLWDSNAKAGHPSKGLLQTIDSTFSSYALPGHGDIWNPIDNAIAAIRYMMAVYHHIVGASGTGYARGTSGARKGLAWVGEKGPELVNFRGGEQVVPHTQSMMLVRGYAKGTGLKLTGSHAQPTTKRQTSTIKPTPFAGLSGPWGGTAKHPTFNGFDVAFLLKMLGLPVGNANQNKIRLLDYLGKGGSPILVGPGGASIGGKGTGTGGPVDTSGADATAATQALTDALNAVKDELKRQTDFATSVSNTSNFQLTKTLSDLISGHIVGSGVAGRAYTPGTGVEVAY